jgi:diguanylate cyclase (GGDEF)-like protein
VEAPVLIVDDDTDVRAFLRAVLESDGHNVIEARTGVEALEHLRHRRLGLVLLDVRMPGMDGFAVVQELKREPGPFLPVILLTGLDDPASRARGIAVGADEVLGKPVHPFELRLRVRAMLRIQQLAGELHVANRRLRQLARTDELTGVRNLRGLRAALRREFRRAQRYHGALSLLAFDVDRFKLVNDTHGHAVGDRVLQAVADALATSVRDVDVVGRSGGEEFLVIAPETPRREALVVAERLRGAVARRTVETEGAPVRVTISCGVATFGEVAAASAAELLQCADVALYRAKMAGRDRVELAGPELEAGIIPR